MDNELLICQQGYNCIVLLVLVSNVMNFAKDKSSYVG